MTNISNFSNELVADIHKQTFILHLQNNNLKLNKNVINKYLKNIGFNITNEKDFIELMTDVLKLQNTGKFKENYIANIENTIFYIKEEKNEICDLNLAYIHYHKTQVKINSVLDKDIIIETSKNEFFRLEALNKNEFTDLQDKNVFVLASCFADKANVILGSSKALKKLENAGIKDESYVPDCSNAKYLSGIICGYTKRLNARTNKMYNEIIIDCLGLKIAVIVADGVLDEQKIINGNILVAKGLLTAVIYEYFDEIDRSLILVGMSFAKSYAICLDKNKRAIFCFNVDKNGKQVPEFSYIFPVGDVKKIKIKKVYNSIFNSQITIYAKGKKFSCYIGNSYLECKEFFYNLDIKINI